MGLFEAYRLSDNVCVVLKIIIDNPTSREREILEYLNRPELRRCPANMTIRELRMCVQLRSSAEGRGHSLQRYSILSI